jgi:hypothetical protein
MSTLSNAERSGPAKAPKKGSRNPGIRKVSAPKIRNIQDPLGDFSEQTGAQFG